MKPDPDITNLDEMPPREVRLAAIKVSTWMKKKCQRRWQLDQVCDRRFAYDAERYRKTLKELAKYGSKQTKAAAEAALFIV